VPLALLFPPSLGQVTASARAELLTDWLGKRLGTYVTVEVAESYTELHQRIASSDVDMAWAPPGICAKVQAQARVVFKAVRSGSSMYQAAIIGRKSEGNDVATLADKRAGWVDELSTGGYLLAAGRLRAAGITSDRLASEEFLGSYGAVVRAILEHQIDFGSIYVREPTPEATQASISTFVGNARAETLGPIAYTRAGPSDGLVVTHRAEDELDLAALEGLVSGPNPTSMLLSMLDAECLVRAAADDYDALLD